MNMNKFWVSSLEMLCQAFSAAAFSCYFFVGLPPFNKWKAALLAWDEMTDRTCERNSCIAFAVCFGSSSICKAVSYQFWAKSIGGIVNVEVDMNIMWSYRLLPEANEHPFRFNGPPQKKERKENLINTYSICVGMCVCVCVGKISNFNIGEKEKTHTFVRVLQIWVLYSYDPLPLFCPCVFYKTRLLRNLGNCTDRQLEVMALNNITYYHSFSVFHHYYTAQTASDKTMPLYAFSICNSNS